MKITRIMTKPNTHIGTFKQGKVYVYKYHDNSPDEVYLLCTEVGLIDMATGGLFQETLPGDKRYSAKLAKYVEMKIIT